MAFFPTETTVDGASSMTMTPASGDAGQDGGSEIVAEVLDATRNLATFLEPFLQILTAVVQAFTAYKLVTEL